MVNSNPGFLTTLSATPNTRIVDGTDNIHSGIINALNVATGGNSVLSGFNITQEDGGTYTKYDVAAGKVLRNGLLVSISARNDIAPGVGERADNDWYATVVVDSSNVIQIRTGASSVSTASVSSLTAGDIPIAIIKYPAGSDHDAIDRLVQFLGYDQTTKGFSAINSGSETLRINANGTLTKGSATLTLPSSTGTVALTSDITYTSAISQGNAGLVPTGGVATANIADDAVTYAKMQNVSATDKILGRDSSGAGIVEELSPSSVRTMLGIETGATADQSNAEIETAYNAQVSQVSSSERTAGDSTAIKRYAPVDIKSMIDTHQTDTNTDVTVANLKTRLNSDLDGDFTIGSQSNDTAIFSGHMTVGGNLTVNGATQTINSTVVTVDDPVFTLGGDATGLNDNKDRGIEFKWHNGSSGKVGFFGFDDSTGKFAFIPDATNSSEVFSGTAGTVVANLEGAVTGNASTATALANSRNFSITGDVTASAVGFTGTGNVALSTTLANDAVATTKIADSAVTSAKIADGTIATGDVADDAITYGKMQDTSTNNRLLGATTAGTIGEVQVATAMVADDAITSAKIADDAVGAEQLASNAVVNASVASNAAIAQSKIDGLVSALSGKEPSQTIGDGLDRTSATLKVDIDGLTIENGIDRTADFIMYDDATNGLRRINPANLFGLLIASDVPDISSAYRATGTALVNADISNSAAISADKIADGSTNKVFTATLKSKLDGVAASATAGADWSSNVSNISVANSQLAGSIANAKLANSSVTINSNSLNLGGTLTLDTDDFAEGTNKFYTDERVDDRVNALITDGEAITTTYNDGSGSLTIEAELATTSNKGVASFSPTNFDVSSGAVTIKTGGVSNSQVASNAAIAQSKISGLVSDLAGKAGSLSDLSITASAAEINILDGVTGVSATEIGYLDGVTSAIQTQLNTKLSTVAVADLSDISALVTAINSNSTDAQLPTAKAVKEYITQQEVEDKDYQISVALSSGIPLITIADQFGGSSTLAVTGGDRITTGINAGRLTISDSGKGAIASAAFNQGLLTLTHDDGTTTTTTLPDSTTDAHGLMTDDQFDKLAGIEALADVTDKANVVASLGLLNESDTLYLGDAGNDTTVRVRGNFFVDGTLTTINQTEINVQDALVFEGATADDYETTLRIIDPTADRVISLPDITGTVVTTGDTATVATAMIADNAIITAKIPTHAVIAAKLASNSVLTTKINDLAVTTAKLANDAVTGAKISFIDDSIAATDTHIMVADGTDYNNVIVSGDATLANTGALTIANNAITTAKINADAIDGTKIADNAINSEHYTDSSIDEAHIANNAVTVGKISGLTDLGSGTVISSTERTKLSGIETSADVTDATNVTAAGAIMDGDFSSNGFMKRTGAGAYAIDANTYLTSLSVTGLSDIAQLEQNLASITDDHAGLATAKAVKAYVDSIPGGVGGMSFVLEDGDGTEVTVADSKEIKFIPASSLLTINWTDVDNGTDADPYDLTFTVDNDLANYSNTNSSFSTTSALTSATAATAITGKVLTNLGTGTGGAIAAGDTILAAMQKLETRTALNDAKVTNTDINVNVANLTARLPQITENVTIGDGTDVTVTTSGALIVTGNLTVNGTTTTIDTNTVNIGDNIIVLNSDETGIPSQDAGIEVERGSASNKTLTWDETNDKWTIGSENFTAGTFTGALTGDVTGNVSGNAGTATILQTARTIAGKSFNGSAAITIATTDLSDISALDTDLSSVSASHDSLATAKAIKTYVDAQVDTEDTLAELDDTNIGSLSAGHLLIYDATAGVWDNAALTGGTNVSVSNGDGAITIASTDTTYSAGQGMALSGTTFSVANPDALTVITDDGAGSTLTATGTDEMMLWDASESAWRVMTLANLSDFAIQNGSGGVSAFKTISVSGQDNIVADATADTLTLTAGSGITIANTAASDTIAFSIAAGAIANTMLADDAVGADELAANAVVNASIASGAAIDMDKLDGDSLATAITDFAQDDLMILSDTSDSGNLVKMTTSNFEDAIFGNISGDATVAAGGALTIAATSVENSMLADDAVTYAKMQNVSATDRILGRDSASAGVIEEITPANLRTMINVADGANNYTHPTSAGNKHIPSGGSAGEFLKYDSSGTAVWATPSYIANTDVDVSVANLKTALAGGFGSNAVTIGDSDDVVTIPKKLVVSSTEIYGNTTIQNWKLTDVAHSADGTSLQIYAGSTTTLGDNNKTGGSMYIYGGQGKGSGPGGEIQFLVAPAGASGNAINSHATAMRILQDKNITMVGGLTVSGADGLTVTGADGLTVTGDLTVNGTTTTINTATVEVEDNILQLNTTQASPDTATAATSGISIYRGNGVTQASLIFDDADDTWDLTNALTVAGTITGNLTGNVTGNASGTAATVTGAAQTAITSVGTLTALQVDNININANTISSTDTNGDIGITPHGTGDIILDGQKWPQADGSANQVLSTDSNGQLSWINATSAAGGGDGLAYSGTTANGVLTYGSSTTIATESTLTYDPSGELSILPASGYGRIEMGGPSGAFIDLKNASSDDYDVRLITDGTGLDITTIGASSPITLRTNNAQRVKIEDAQTTLAHHLSFGTTSNPYIKAGTGGPLAIRGDEDGLATSYSSNTPTYSTAASIQLRVNASNQTAMEIQNNKDIKTYGFLKSGTHGDVYGANTFIMGVTGSTADNDWFEVFRWTPKTDGGSDNANWQYDNFQATFQVTARGIGRSNFNLHVRGEYGTQDNNNGWWTREFIIDGWDDAVADPDTTFRMVYNAGTGGSTPYASLYQKRDEDWEYRQIKLIQCFTNCYFDYLNTNVGETDPTHDTNQGSYNNDPSIRRKLYVDANEQLINGVSATGIYFDNTNNRLGVGTATPSTLLHLSASDPVLKITDTTGSDNRASLWLQESDSYGARIAYESSGNDFFNINIIDAGTETTRMVIDRYGKVGIGTTSPASKLQVLQGDTEFSIIAGADVSASSLTNDTRKFTRIGMPHYHTAEEPAILMVGDSDGTNNYTKIGGGTSAGNAATVLQFYTAANDATVTGTERMRITSGGNVGIGTTSPQTALEVRGDTSAPGAILTVSTADTVILNDDVIGKIQFNAPLEASGTDAIKVGASVLAIAEADYTSSVNSTALVFQTAESASATEKMRIASDGNVGIGTTSPGHKLHVTGPADSTTAYAGYFDEGTDQYVALVNRHSGNRETAKFYRNITAANTSAPMVKIIQDHASDDQTALYIKQDGSGASLLMESTESNASNDAPDLVMFRNIGSPGADTQLGSIKFRGRNNNSQDVEYAEIQSEVESGIDGSENGRLKFSTMDDGTLTTVMTIDGQSNIKIPTDAGKLYLGASDELSIYHDGSHSRITHDAATDSWLIFKNTDGAGFQFNIGSDKGVEINKDGNVELYYDNSLKLATASTGVTVTGALTATTKSFDIEHPTEEGKRLHHGSLEGPEHGVYIRGRLEGDTIELPDYWLGLVDEDTITVQLTANKFPQSLFVKDINEERILIGRHMGEGEGAIDCFYFIQAERKDVEKMVVEY